MAKVYDVDMFPYCPSSDWSCPYYSKETDRCMMFEEENILPYDECDNFFDEDGFNEFEVGKFSYNQFSANP